MFGLCASEQNYLAAIRDLTCSLIQRDKHKKGDKIWHHFDDCCHNILKDNKCLVSFKSGNNQISNLYKDLEDFYYNW